MLSPDDMNIEPCTSCDRLSRELAEARQALKCDVCLGQPISDKPCICNGTGSIVHAAINLRSELVKAEQQLAQQVAANEAIQKALLASIERLSYLSNLGDEQPDITLRILKDARAALAAPATSGVQS